MTADPPKLDLSEEPVDRAELKAEATVPGGPGVGIHLKAPWAGVAAGLRYLILVVTTLVAAFGTAGICVLADIRGTGLAIVSAAVALITVVGALLAGVLAQPSTTRSIE